MIVMGYPAIGKTSLAEKGFEYIDLEATDFFVMRESKNGYDSFRPGDWYKIYVNQVLTLHRQGYTVLISSHKDIRNRINYFRSIGQFNNEDQIFVCYPILSLKDQWIEKVKKRLEEDRSFKNIRAYDRVSKYYDQDILDLSSAPFGQIKITTMNYDFESLILTYSKRTEYLEERRQQEEKNPT